jgi:hypothetical protein
MDAIRGSRHDGAISKRSSLARNPWREHRGPDDEMSRVPAELSRPRDGHMTRRGNLQLLKFYRICIVANL